MAGTKEEEANILGAVGTCLIDPKYRNDADIVPIGKLEAPLARTRTEGLEGTKEISVDDDGLTDQLY